MTAQSFVLIDRARAEQFGRLGRTRRLFAAPDVWTDDGGVAWAVKAAGDCDFALTWLGPGWVFDPYAAARWVDDLAAARGAMAGAGPDRRRQELLRAARRLRLGPHAERLLWSVHRLVLAAHASVIKIPDFLFGVALWGPTREAWPRQWRQEIIEVLKGLTWLHVADHVEGAPMGFGRATALLTHAADLRGGDADVCDEHCPGRGERPHHHYLVNVGAGFLGGLERFARGEVEGVRTYRFPVPGRRGAGPTLRRTGKTGALVTAYLPARLGDPRACGSLTAAQHRLLQALVRETTRGRRAPGRPSSEVEVLDGNLLPDASGKGTVECPFLGHGGRHVGFNGNGVRPGLGYYLTTPGGWLAKVGYSPRDIPNFLSDVRGLADALGLAAVGVEKSSGQCHDLRRLEAMAAVPALGHALGRVLVRFYAPADYVRRWNGYFGWDGVDREPPPQVAGVLALADQMASKKINRRALASGVGVDASFISKAFNGRKPWPPGLLDRAVAWAAAYDQGASSHAAPAPAVMAEAAKGGNAPDAALAYCDGGWSVVPQRPGAKKPCVRWKPFQLRPPTTTKLRTWFGRWRDAGLALVLGPVSGVFVVDVDGPDAHAALLERLGEEPVAPKAFSGSRKPCRYHLFFRYPHLPTRAKATPWHPQLEFRGKGGIVVVPPSLHKSGHRYAWAPGRSPVDLPTSEVPPLILAALQPPPRPAATVKASVPDRIETGPSTRRFLAGEYAGGPRWNDRLFRAACDLAGRGMALEAAEPLLQAGACPWNAGEWEAALRTIHSAYSQSRSPGRH